jgi:hypothetical protein
MHGMGNTKWGQVASGTWWLRRGCFPQDAHPGGVLIEAGVNTVLAAATTWVQKRERETFPQRNGNPVMMSLFRSIVDLN